MGQAIMLGSLFRVIVVIVGSCCASILRRAARTDDGRGEPVGDDLTPLLTASIVFAYVNGHGLPRRRAST